MSSGIFQSSWVSFFIGIGLLFILFLLYLIGTEMYKIHSLELIFKEEEQELELQKQENVDLEEEVKVRETAEFLDRFAKENHDYQRPGEVVIIVPENTEEEEMRTSSATAPWQQKSNREQWKDVFFGGEM